MSFNKIILLVGFSIIITISIPAILLYVFEFYISFILYVLIIWSSVVAAVLEQMKEDYE